MSTGWRVVFGVLTVALAVALIRDLLAGDWRNAVHGGAFLALWIAYLLARQDVVVARREVERLKAKVRAGRRAPAP